MVVFPCIICDRLVGSSCSADELERDVNDISGCPLSPPPAPQEIVVEETRREKPDMGHWVIKQPDGLFCYYDETSGKIERRDMALEDVIFYRVMTYGMDFDHAEEDTKSQVEHQPIRWEDITR